jgi:hypothetical protein
MNAANTLCPQHNVPLVRKRIVYGLVDPRLLKPTEHDQVILGGCVVTDESHKFGFECRVDHKVYYRNRETGELEEFEEEADPAEGTIS